MNEEVQPEDRLQRLDELLPYLRDLQIGLPKAVVENSEMQPIAPEVTKTELHAEIDALPAAQCLMEYKNFIVCYGDAGQLPRTLDQIARLRELTFRAHQEGSGQAEDRDRFDENYLHLFAWDLTEHAIVGAYRLGKTDLLRAEEGNAGVYLAQMFDFADEFYAGPPLLEIGRSFVAPDYQRNTYSLFLLWCGISRYLLHHPKYRQLYGVVSMSRLYDARAMAVMRDVLLEPRPDVRAEDPYEPDLGGEWQEFLEETRPMTMKDLSRIVKALEDEARDIPVLIRHYHKLGARFHAAVVDRNFNNTPGLLLRLNVPAMPRKYLKMYFGEGDLLERYLAYGD
ncbi:MAG: GNAT family N-acetyltransferase [Pseudomonadales bacterium]|nr:GNAT family N-acetyltransferase [Pseudomonadales bacterium]